ncbi:hypothetical protein IG631_05586 [Alternaria alternata]|nr:hypothetical protein IG631_05586 [Alternaria alternata]
MDNMQGDCSSLGKSKPQAQNVLTAPGQVPCEDAAKRSVPPTRLTRTLPCFCSSTLVWPV